MTVSNSESSSQENDLFAPIYPYRFANLTTFRKNGEAVPTTIWFAPDSRGHLYMVTQISTGKVKRMRHNPSVQLVPSDAGGTVLNEQIVVTGYAREMAEEQRDYAIAMLTQKYGDEYTNLMASSGGSKSATRTYVEIVASPEQF